MGNNIVKQEQGDHTQNDPGPSTSDYQPDDQEDVKKPTDIEELVEGITIAGIEDAYKSKIPLEKAMYILAIILFFYAMIHSSVLIGNRYMEEGSIEVNQSIVFGQVAPFPTVTVCSTGIWNKEVVLVFPDRIDKRMKEVGVTKEDVIDFIRSLSNARVKEVMKKEALKVIGVKVLDASIEMNPNLIVDAMRVPCPEVLSNCAFGGETFNCCQIAEFMYTPFASCWHINVNRIELLANTSQVIGGKITEPSKIIFSGLILDVATDPSASITNEEVISDSLVIHIDILPSPFSSPATIPFGADAIIQLSPPTQIKEIDNCLPANKLPKLKRFNFYDSYRVACFADLLNELVESWFGCSLPVLNFMPDNGTQCPANIFYLLARITEGDVPPLPKEMEKKTNSINNRDFLRNLYYGNTCPVPCTRWTYPILSTSYGYIQYRDDPQPNISSLSRVRIFFPEASYRLYTEEKVNMFYLAFCEMGGVWGVYLGFSIVSVFQAAAYGVIIIWKKKKKKKAVPSNTMQMKRVGWV